MSSSSAKITDPPLHASGGRVWGWAALVSVLVHALALGVWAWLYEPQTGTPEATKRRVIKAVGRTPAPKPEPVAAPEPEPEPEPEPAPEPKPEPEPRPEDLVESVGPPPPPAPCPGCAMAPSELGVPKHAPRNPNKAGVPMGVPGGVPGGVVGGVPGGVVGGVPGGVLGSRLGPRPPTPTNKPAPEPLDVVLQRAIYTPHPDPKLLARTKTGTLDRHDGVNRTSFCIDERGRTVSVKTSKAFGGDPKIDEICRDTVAQWRFKPLRLEGRARRVCSVAVFEIRFE